MQNRWEQMIQVFTSIKNYKSPDSIPIESSFGISIPHSAGIQQIDNCQSEDDQFAQ
jgi:hypothetical protein